MNKFRIEIVTSAMFILHGQVSKENAAVFKEVLAFCSESKNVYLDFDDVCYISAEGLQAIVERQKNVSGQIYILNPPEVIEDILEFAGYKDLVATVRA